MHRFLRTIRRNLSRRPFTVHKPLIKTTGEFKVDPTILPHEIAESEEEETSPKWGEVTSKDTDYYMESNYWTDQLSSGEDYIRGKKI